MNSSDLSSLELIQKFIESPTVSRDSNLKLIEFIRDYLADLGVNAHVFKNAEQTKASIYATLGPANKPGIMLAGHTDVVPVDGQEWHTDPWKLVEKDGRLFGRGTTDMKGFCAIALSFAPIFLERGLETPIHYGFTFEEEINRVGINAILDGIKDFPVRPAMCIVGEPSEMKVIVAHKGKKSIRCRVRGFECHSSLAPTGVNAIEYAAELISFIKNVSREFSDGIHDEAYDIPFTTFSVGLIQGGTALNIVSKDCVFQFEFRHLPSDDPESLYERIVHYAQEELEPRMHMSHADTGIAFEIMSEFPALDTDPDEEVVSIAKRLSQQNDHGKVAFGTEASVISKHGHIPTVVCGPGSIDQAHKPDEFIAIDQVAKCEEFMHRLADSVCKS
jgi:acetylornithine deacetylase